MAVGLQSIDTEQLPSNAVPRPRALPLPPHLMRYCTPSFSAYSSPMPTCKAEIGQC